MPMFLRSFPKPNGLMSHDAVVVVAPSASEANLARIASATLGDGDEAMPAFEPWCGYDGGSTPDPRAKRFNAPAVEANGDFLTMVTETLLQSHAGVIRVFPGWPGDRGAAQFSGLVAEGGVTVSARTQGGRVQFVELGRRAGVCPPGGEWKVRLKSPWTGEIGEWEVEPGQAVVLTESGVADEAPGLAPGPPEEAGPRAFWRDAHATLWLGRPARGVG